MHQSSQSSRAAGPSSITLPPPPVFSSFTLQGQGYTPEPSQAAVDTPSPNLVFRTAPSSPFSEPPSPVSPPVQWYTPPTTPQNDPLGAHPQQQHAPALSSADPVPASGPIAVPLATRRLAGEQADVDERSESDDAFPNTSIIDLAFDSGFDEEGLNTLEKIYLYSRSESSIHRTFIAHALPSYLEQVTPQEAVEYVLPLIHNLAVDEEESVKAALATELVPVIWWFFSHCQLIPDGLEGLESFASTSSTVTIPVEAFTPILGTLLLGTSEKVITPARFAILDMLSRMRRADARETGVGRVPSSSSSQANIAFLSNNLIEDDDESPCPATGLFKMEERGMFRQELLHSVIIGMSRLDMDDEPMDVDEPSPQANTEAKPGSGTSHSNRPSPSSQQENPYFPSLSHSSNSTRSASSTPPASPPTGQKSRNETRTSSFSPVHSPTSPNTSPRPPAPPRRSPPPSPGSEWPEEKPPSRMEQDHRQEFDEAYDHLGSDARKAALGRLSSMSLIAAVTATGSLEEEFQRAFVKETDRVGHDGEYFYVRREASLALGALAKVVPQELVSNTLLPLFDTLRWDQDHRVRQSALFALPAILSRLPANQRRTVALETTGTLSKDCYGRVRVAVLETLGEVLHTFQNDPGGPPKEMLDLFLGRPEDANIRDGTHWSCYNELEPQPAEQTLELFLTDPDRPLICAFNFPAVALTVGRARWPELRSYYADLARNKNVLIRKTMAASLGEIAGIIGEEATLMDLLPVWWDSLNNEDETVRTKAVEALESLLPNLGREAGKAVMGGLLSLWESGRFRGWRERENILMFLEKSVKTLGRDVVGDVVRRLILKGLEDNVSAVREKARFVLPRIWDLLSPNPVLRAGLQADVESLANSPVFRRRMTYIACMETRAQHLDELQMATEIGGMLTSVVRLAKDTVIDVRIAVSRFLSVLRSRFGDRVTSAEEFRRSVQTLASDPSHDIKAFLLELESPQPAMSSSTGHGTYHTALRHTHSSLFSRPPTSPLASPTRELDSASLAVAS